MKNNPYGNVKRNFEFAKGSIKSNNNMDEKRRSEQVTAGNKKIEDQIDGFVDDNVDEISSPYSVKGDQ